MRCVLTRSAAVGGLALLALVLAGCGSSGGGGKIDLTAVEDNQVALNVEGMVWANSWVNAVRNALTSLPGVEKDSVKVSKDQKLATFKVREPQEFKVEDAIKKIEGIGKGYKATVAKSGRAFVASGKS